MEPPTPSPSFGASGSGPTAGPSARVHAVRVRRPWFDRNPALALAVAAALALAIFVVRLAVGDEGDAIAMLYVLPVALVAISSGRRGGVVAGLVAIGLLAVWTWWDDVVLSPLGWLSRTVPFLLIGLLVGHASDRIRAADEAERRADAIALLHLDGAEINDHIVQSLAAAKWAIEAGDSERARAILEDTIVAGQQLVTRVLGSDSVALGRRPAPDRDHRRHRSSP